MGGGQANLVAVAGIAVGRLVGNHPLGQFAGDGILHLGGDVSGAGYPHRLIHIGAAGERVPDGTAQAGGSASEGFYLCRVIVRFILELQQPLLVFSVHVHRHEDAAGVVFLALLQVFQKAFGFEPAGTQGGQLHQAQGLGFPAQGLSHPGHQGQGGLYISFDKGIVHLDFLQGGGKGGVAAMVAPIGIQDAQFRSGRIPAFLSEILRHAGQVVAVHRKALFLAEGGVLGNGQLTEAAEVFHGLHAGLLILLDKTQVFPAAFHRIDVVGGNLVQRFLREVFIEQQQAGALDADIGRRVYQVNTVAGRRSPLVKLPGQVLYGQVLAGGGSLVRDKVCDGFSENAVAALFHQLLRKTEKVVDIDEPQAAQGQGQILIEVLQKGGGFHTETFPLLYK